MPASGDLKCQTIQFKDIQAASWEVNFSMNATLCSKLQKELQPGLYKTIITFSHMLVAKYNRGGKRKETA